MNMRLFWRRSAAAAGIYASVLVGFLGTVIAAHAFSTRALGLYALVLAATGFFQTLLDLTVEEALVKYGFRFQERADWGRLRRLFVRAVQLKVAGGILAAGVLVALAPAAGSLFGAPELLYPFLLAAAPRSSCAAATTYAPSFSFSRWPYALRASPSGPATG